MEINVTGACENSDADGDHYIPCEQLVTVDMPADEEEEVTDFKDNNSKLMSFFRCSNCNRMYVRENGLRQHIRFECGQIPKFSCSVCLKKFHRNSTLKRHIQTVHTKHILNKSGRRRNGKLNTSNGTQATLTSPETALPQQTQKTQGTEN